jgi:hypothetical protein
MGRHPVQEVVEFVEITPCRLNWTNIIPKVCMLVKNTLHSLWLQLVLDAIKGFRA